MKTYRVELPGDEFEIIFAENDDEAMKKAWELEEQYGVIFNVFEIDDDYEIVKTVF